MSLIVHPAPRMTRAPAPNIANNWRSGNCPADVAKHIDQPHGQNKSQVPKDQWNISDVQAPKRGI